MSGKVLLIPALLIIGSEVPLMIGPIGMGLLICELATILFPLFITTAVLLF
jgi:hypothetical protein